MNNSGGRQEEPARSNVVSFDPATPLQDRLVAASGRLTNADRDVWAALSRDLSEAIFLSVEAVATEASVNQASVVRFAQKLGYSGFVELRNALRAQVQDNTSPGQRLRKLFDTADPANGSLASSLAQQAYVLAMAAQTLSEADFHAATEALARARRIYVFASGHATSIAELALRRLTRIGCDVVDLRGAPRDVIERVATIGADDVLLSFAFRIAPRHLAVLLDLAAERGVKIVGVTDLLTPDMARSGATILAASRGKSGDYQTLTVPMAIFEALSVSVAKRMPDRATDALDSIAEVAKRFEPGSSSRSAAHPLEKRGPRHRDR